MKKLKNKYVHIYVKGETLFNAIKWICIFLTSLTILITLKGVNVI